MGATPFTKPATTIAQQLQHLQAEGMAIPDMAQAEHWLRHVSYYRLSAYWLPFEHPKGNPGLRFLPGTSLSPRLETLLDGRPQVIIRDGAIIEANLRRDRITRAEVEAEMRLAGIARLSDVAWGILETQGKISFIRRDEGEVQRRDDDPDAG